MKVILEFYTLSLGVLWDWAGLGVLMHVRTCDMMNMTIKSLAKCQHFQAVSRITAVTLPLAYCHGFL